MSTKKLTSYITIINLLFLFISFGCSSDEDNDSNPLSSRESAFVGTWVLTKVTVTDLSGTYELTPAQAQMSVTIIARSNKSFSINSTIEGETVNTEGTWSVNGDFLVLSSIDENRMVPYTISGNTFSITVYIQQDDILISQVLEFTKQ